MNPLQTFLAVDLGASSGRVMAGWLDGNRHIQLEEVRRFENVPITVDETLCWNFEELIAEIFAGIETGIAQASDSDRPVATIGIDSWAVDFGLLDDDGKLTGPVVHYRDGRTDGVMEEAFQTVSREEIFRTTGIQFLPFNTIYQLVALKQRDPSQLSNAKKLLMIADLVAWRLTGETTCEYTNATTTQLFDTTRKEWSWDLIERFGLPAEIFPTPIEAGSAIGPLLPELAKKWNAENVRVVAAATHDTASAVVAVPSEKSNFAYLSCGTWSLLGTELDKPIISDKMLAANFTNEGGAFGKIRLLKNIMGLWILQECRRQWKSEGKDYDWSQLEHMAKEADGDSSLINVDDPRFLPPGDMPSRVRAYCREQAASQDDRVQMSDGAVVRCILQSLAKRYAQVLNDLERITGHRFDALHIVGGGIRNRLLCEWTAKAIGRPVLAGPTEATALGNIGVQMIAVGVIKDLAELRLIVKASVPPMKYVNDK